MKKYIILTLLTLSILCIANSADASAPLHGWGWSSTIGWISFNSTDTNSSYSYGVSVSTSSNSVVGVFDGYGWSSNIGWVSFRLADVSSCGSQTNQANVNLETGVVSGWARATAGGSSESGGWDGCIKLAGENHPSNGNDVSGGVFLSTTTGNFLGKAWGDMNVGWLSFASVSCPECVGKPAPEIPVTPFTASCASTTATTYANTSASSPVTIGFSATASGGTPPYKYYWKGFTSLSGQTNSTTSIMSGTDVTVTGPSLTVSDSGSLSESPTCPSVIFGKGFTNPDPDVQCNTAGHSCINGNIVGIVTSDGTNYNWTCQGSAGGQISCQDSTGDPFTNIPVCGERFSCILPAVPSNNVEGARYDTWRCTYGGKTTSCSLPAGFGGNGLGLAIGPPGRTSYLSLPIEKNKPFSLAWVNNLPTEYDDCSVSVSGVNAAPPSNWLSIWSSGYEDKPSGGNLNANPLNSGNIAGTYSFTLSCDKKEEGVTVDNETAQVSLKVYSSSVKEE